MRLYAGASADFIQLNFKHKLVPILEEEFFSQLGYKPSKNEVMSWRNSLFQVAVLLQENNLIDHGILVEHQLPLNSRRIDLIICGKDKARKKNAVVVELKQWDHCTLSEYDSDRVLTWVAGGNKSLLHPSIQAGNYKNYLEQNQTAFYTGTDPIKLFACSYLHNYSYDKSDALFDERFSSTLKQVPLFTADHTDDFGNYLKTCTGDGEGMEVLKEIEEGKYRPSKKLLHHISTIVKEKLASGETRIIGQTDDYILIDDQLVVYDNVISVVEKGLSNKKKFAIIVKGGPGTGKSVIALKLLADLAGKGKNIQYATGSRSFTQTLRKIVGKSSESFFKYFMSYGEAQPNEVDLLIMDEAHRIRSKTGYPFKSTGRAQIEDLIRASKVSIFFIDDFQSVRAGEIGSVNYIREFAEKMNCQVFEYELEAQFRCGGSAGYINWINNTLHIERTANALWNNTPEFEFRIFKSPQEVEDAIRQKAKEGFSARMTAGFCWKWSDEFDAEGNLVNDVVIGEYKRPWNARPEAKKLPKNIPSANYWAYDANGINQVGCIYTAQGFEFDYAGVIIGNDLTFDFDTNEWIGNAGQSFDGQVKKSTGDFLQLVKNTYRVLLTRGMRGCYVCFTDKDTERFFRSRLE